MFLVYVCRELFVGVVLLADLGGEGVLVEWEDIVERCIDSTWILDLIWQDLAGLILQNF